MTMTCLQKSPKRQIKGKIYAVIYYVINVEISADKFLIFNKAPTLHLKSYPSEN